MDDDPAGIVYITCLICTFILSAFFSIVKIVFSSAAQSAAGTEDGRVRYYASQAGGILKNRAALSSAVTVWKTLSNVAFAILAFNYHNILFPNAAAAQRFGVPLAFSFLALTLFAHYIPRAFALTYYNSYIAAAFYLYSLLSWLLMPFSRLFSAVQSGFLKLMKYDEKLAFLSDEDKARIAAGQDGAEALNEEEREMIRGIFDLSETTADEIMTPRINISAADINAGLHSILAIIREHGHSRIPVYKETVDQITGILYVKDILSWLSEHKAEEWDAQAIAKKCHYVPMGKKINDLMKDFRLKHLHLAVIVDEYGGTAGIVTMEDILEEIVGEIQDEYDEEKMDVVRTGDNIYSVNPHIDLHGLNDALNIDLDEEAGYNTLSGLIYHEYGDVPHEDTQFEYSGLRITILKMDNQRIDKVKVEVLSSEKAAPEPF